MHAPRAIIALSMTVSLSTMCSQLGYAAESSVSSAGNKTGSKTVPAPSPPPKAAAVVPSPLPLAVPNQVSNQVSNQVPSQSHSQAPSVPLMRSIPVLDTRVARPGEPLKTNSIPAPLPTRVARPGAYLPSTGSLSSPVSPPLNIDGAKDAYPAIGQLESLTLGSSSPALHIDQRLANLETAIFKKTFQYDSLFDRTERLKKTILGSQDVDPNSAAGREDAASRRSTIGGDPLDNSRPLESLSEVNYLDEQAALPENFQAATEVELGQYAISLINKERQNFGVAPVTPDNIAEKVASDLSKDLARRNLLSHFSADGNNPDRRFTLQAGNDALNEAIASIKTAELGGRRTLCKSAVARILKIMLARQDDRDALLNPDATHIGFSPALSADGERIIGAAEVLSRHAIMIPVATSGGVGDRIEVRGVMHSPYIFDKVTLAWEAYNPDGNASATDDAEEALPYFPPLDYVAYSNHSEGNHDKAVLALKTGLIVGAVAAGLFFPPAAMAVPLIAFAGSPGEPKPVSDIPVKGGMHVDGAAFSGHIPLSNDGKDGLYYVTVWAVQAKGMKSIPVSRRVILIKGASQQDSRAQDESEQKEKDERKESHRREKEDRKAKDAQDKQTKQENKLKNKNGHGDKGEPSQSGLKVEGEVEPAEPDATIKPASPNLSLPSVDADANANVNANANSSLNQAKETKDAIDSGSSTNTKDSINSKDKENKND